MIERVVHLDNNAWQGDEPSQPEAVLWPTWESAEPAEGPSASDGTALDGIHASWASSTDRIRDSAKWLATIIGVALGALVGTSPLADLGPHPFTTAGWTCALLGLASLAVTMFLVGQVLRPSDVSYDEIQQARTARNPLTRWKNTVQSQQDLWLPTGVKCLETLRQAMIVDELTLMALSCALGHLGVGPEDRTAIQEAGRIRRSRLREYRRAASRIVQIGEFYRVRRRSAWATYLGAFLGMTGTALVIAAFSISR